jgi:ABC-type sulfate transport system permease subunit
MPGFSQANAISSHEFCRVTLPDWKRAIEAAAILPNERLVAEFLEFVEVHGNSLGLTSKSPLTCTRMAGAVVQRIGGAWA